MTVRPGSRDDLASIAQIQAASPEAAQWPTQDYLAHDFLIACCEDSVAGFAVARRVAADEAEILNLAVEPAWRRRGVGRALVETISKQAKGNVYLEVRESNRGARQFYERLGFRTVGLRPQYYRHPDETAIVMKFHSC